MTLVAKSSIGEAEAQTGVNISVVVPTRNHGEAVVPTILSILQDPSCRLEVIVVDQSDFYTTKSALMARGLLADERLKYHRSTTLGASRARNEGLRLAQGDLIAFVDDDCVVSSRWSGAISDRFHELPEMAVFFGNVVADPEAQSGWIPEYRTPHEGRINESTREIVRYLGLTANLAVRRQTLQTIGMFDELLGPGTALANGEDTDFGYRAVRAGLGVYAFNEPFVIHHGLRLGREQIAVTANRYLQGLGAFCMKHARCGDLQMLSPAFRESATLFAQGTRHLMRGDRPSGFRGAINVLRGVLLSWRYRVHHQTRLYSSWLGSAGEATRLPVKEVRA